MSNELVRNNMMLLLLRKQEFEDDVPLVFNYLVDMFRGLNNLSYYLDYTNLMDAYSDKEKKMVMELADNILSNLNQK